MSKVLVGRELLERILNWREGDAGDSGRDELIDTLAAQPAEAEGAIQRPASHPAECYALGTHVVHASLVHGIVRQADELNAALSAVTAERDRLQKDAERWRYVSLQGDDTHWLNLLRVDLEDFGGNINAAVDALIDGEAPAMAAKEAGPEHVCSGCGAKGWTGNCLECIPY
ncbi:hypothetical protein [Stutzerimonas nitrititolerans]|uniref:hypothetical protein n=1 Tax=Stutzerimonas nitrititolerans TaxID=2482751 RepID=UPI00289EB837|nr:hypothetical protein [Stutzerimonas nitrititolerans]